MKTSSYDEPSDHDDVSVATFDSTASDPQPEGHEAMFAKVTPNYYHSTVPSEPPPVPKRSILPPASDESVSTERTEISLVSEVVDSVYRSIELAQIQEDIPEESEELEESVNRNEPSEPSPSEVTAVVQSYRDIQLVSPEDTIQKTDVNAERWSDTTSISLPGQVEDVEAVTSDTDPANAQCDPVSEMYYTASSEVSLLSDTELPDKGQNEDEDKDDRKNVIAGHVAAMRERFESMTRTNTPCPDLARSLSPSLEVFRNTSPSPDRLA